MRLNLPVAASLLPLALLDACATHHSGPEPVQGLVYDCRDRGGAPIVARILFNGQGYQPAGGVIVPDSAVLAPRSTATLWLGSARHELRADWAYLGMRYRSESEHGPAIIWAADGEAAQILSGSAGTEAEVAACMRRRQVAEPQAEQVPHGTNDTHHR